MNVVEPSGSLDVPTTRSVPAWIFIACALPGIVTAVVKAQSNVYVMGVSTGLNDAMFVALGPCAWLAYLPAAKHAGSHAAWIGAVWLVALLFPFWGMFGMLMGVGYGGPLLCTAWWSLFLAGTFGLRGTAWVMGAGIACNLVSLAIAFAYRLGNPGSELFVTFLAVAVVSWHVFHPIGLFFAARERRRQVERGAICSYCGYDRTRLPGQVCPECGELLVEKSDPVVS